MARYHPIKNSFVAGELSQRLEGRDDLEQYHQGSRQLENLIVLPHGGVTRRPGTAYTAEVKDSSEQGRLIPFVYSTEVAYVIVANDGVFRYFANGGALASVGAFDDGALFDDEAGFSDIGDPIQDGMPYTAAQLRDIQWAQTGDVMFFVHPNHPLYWLRRISSTNFTMAARSYAQGKAPLLAPNTDTGHTITAVQVSGNTYTLTGSEATWDLQNGTDVGRAVRLKDGSDEAWFKVTSVSSTTVATVARQSGTAPAGATDDWSLGMFSDTDGAFAIAFHENRLWLGGCPRDGERVAGSDSGVYNRFSNDASLDDNAIYVSTASTGQVQTVRWLSSNGNALWVGTASGEGVVDAAEDGILTPSNARYRPRTKRGSVHVMPVEVDSDILFLQRDARMVRRLSFELASDKNVAEPLSILAEHIFRRGGGVEMAYQQSPDSVVWVVRGDGQLVGLTVEPTQKVIGAHRHIFGGVSDAIDTQAVCESVAVIPSPDGTQDQVWVLMKRRINGGTKRYVEYMKPVFDPDIGPNSTTEERINALDEAWFLDCAIELNDPVAITGITAANPPVVSTATSHGRAEGDTVLIRGVYGMTEVNRRKYTVSNPTSNTFELQTDAPLPLNVDGSDYTAYIQGGEVHEIVETISGLDHLEGETVSVSADGAPHPDATVSSGSITLSRGAARVLVGLHRKALCETQRFTGGGQLGSDQGQKHRIPRLAIRFHNTAGCKVGVGPVPETLEQISFRESDWSMDAPPPLFTDDKEVPTDGGWTTTPTVYFESDGANMPLTALAIMPRNQSGER